MSLLIRYIKISLALFLFLPLFNCGDEDNEVFVEVKSEDGGGNGSSHVGDVFISSMKDLSDFSATKYKIIQGNLIVQGKAINDINGLNGLEQVSGDIIIDNTTITNLDGFSNLIMVKGKLVITNNKWLGYYDFNYCGIQNLFINGFVDFNLVTIRDNAASYYVIVESPEDIIELDCN